MLKYSKVIPRIHEIKDIEFKFYNFKLVTLKENLFIQNYIH